MGLRQFSVDIASDPESRLERALDAALATNDLTAAIRAMRDAARKGGMSSLSRATGLNRENLYRMLADDANPKLDTVLRILDVYGLRLSVRRGSDLSS